MQPVDIGSACKLPSSGASAVADGSGAGDDAVVPLLQGVGSSGIRGAIRNFLLGIPIWAGQTLALVLQFLRNPVKFFRRSPWDELQLPGALPGEVHHWLDVGGGVRLHALSLGPRDTSKPLMLFLHGFPEFSHSWRHQLAEFSADYDAVALDMRGYNLSSKPRGVSSYGLDVLAADVASAVRCLGAERAVVVAHDWGGAVAWVVAGMYPQVVDRLVVMASMHLGLSQVNWSAKQEARSWYMLMFQAPLLPELLLTCRDGEVIRELYKPGSPAGPKAPGACSPEDVELYVQAFMRRGVATSTINYYRALLRHSTIAPIPSVWAALKRRLDMPVLAMMAEDDTALGPELLNGLDQVAPVSELHVLRHCSHWIPIDQPATVNALMRAFLARHPPSARGAATAAAAAAAAPAVPMAAADGEQEQAASVGGVEQKKLL